MANQGLQNLKKIHDLQKEGEISKILKDIKDSKSQMEAFFKQLKERNEEYKISNPFVQGILNNTLPLTIGGGIGQSRLCMYFLKKKHIGEVQSSVWGEEYLKNLAKENIHLL